MRSFLSGYLIVDLPSHSAIRSICKFHQTDALRFETDKELS